MAVTAIAGAGVAAYGSLEAGAAADKLAKYNAAQGRINADAAMRDADIRANAIRQRNRIALGKQRAALGASGVVADTGSPLLLQLNSAAELEKDAIEAERQGGIEAGKMLQQAELDLIEGKNAKKAGKIGAVSSILKGVGSAAGAFAGGGGVGGGGSGKVAGTFNSGAGTGGYGGSVPLGNGVKLMSATRNTG
jgi:hypothetical protein